MTTTPNLYKKMYLAIVAVALLLLVTGTASAQWSPTASPTPTPGTNIYYNSGNVGIGTTSPGDKLQIVGGGIQIGNAVGNPGAVVSFLGSQSGTGRNFQVGNQIQVTDSFTITPSTATGGSTFTTPALTILGASGNVGIGTTSPGSTLDVRGNTNIVNTGGVSDASSALYINSTSSYIGMAINAPTSQDSFIELMNNGSRKGGITWVGSAGTPYLNMDAGGSASIALNPNGGNVGIGKTNPTVALDVVGSINLTGTVNAKYQDVAEWVLSSERLSAGTVVVLDLTKSNQVISSSVGYDTRVAGVVSERPGLALGEGGEGRVLVATTGRVLVNVDATKGPIHIGDLLVTSTVPGMAMKSDPVNLGGVQLHRPGTLIGKALEPLEKGSGKILVLLSLQ